MDRQSAHIKYIFLLKRNVSISKSKITKTELEFTCGGHDLNSVPLSEQCSATLLPLCLLQLYSRKEGVASIPESKTFLMIKIHF